MSQDSFIHPTLSPLSDVRTGTKVTPTFKQIVKLAQKSTTESVEQPDALPSAVRARALASSNIHDALVQVINDGLVNQSNQELMTYLQELKGEVSEDNKLASRALDLVNQKNELASKNTELMTRMIKMQEAFEAKQDELKQLQIQALDRLALLQNSVKTLLGQTYELYENPIPRLFIVLPQDNSSWNPQDISSNRLRLYFLCECGDHTKSNNSRISHHIHLAKHEGYDVVHAKEFFQQYGFYVLTILRMLKFRTPAAGITIPAAPLLVREDTVHKATTNLKTLVGNIQSGMDQVIDCIENVPANQGVFGGDPDQIENLEAWEGVDISKLEMFMEIKDKNRPLGNLYRTVTTEGHVKWVCIDHYREKYKEMAARVFRDTVESLRGSFDENIGRVEVLLRSKVQAEQFYFALERAKPVYELKIRLDWETTQSDFRRLRDTLSKTNVGVLELDLNNVDGNQVYDPIFDIMRHPTIQSVTINGAKDLIKQSTLQSGNDDFPNLKRLDIDLLYLDGDISDYKSLIAKAPNLSGLVLRNDGGDFLQIYIAIAEYQTYPITFQQRGLCIPPPKREPNQSMADHQYMAHLFKVQGEMTLDDDELKESAVDAFAKEALDGSSLKEIKVFRGAPLSDAFIKNIASIVAMSELQAIEIYTRGDVGRVQILESIQWEHLRELVIGLRGSLEESVMKALVDGVKKTLGGVEMEEFMLCSESDYHDPLAIPQDGYLSAFVASTSLKKLTLDVFMTLEQVLSLLSSVDFSRMQELRLSTRSFDSAKVDAILDSIQQAKELRYVGLWRAAITEKQKERMKAKGVTLRADWIV